LETITTQDLYECAYYLSNNCEIVSVTSVKLSGQVTCQFAVSGKELAELQAAYFKGNALINLFHFRRKYTQLMNYVSEAKKKAKKEEKKLSVPGETSNFQGGAL
jgi:hypothetical protein